MHDIRDMERLANTKRSAIEDVYAERQRQINTEGYNANHDEGYLNGELCKAAAAYAQKAAQPSNDLRFGPGSPPPGFPWSPRFWKPTTPRRDLVKAAALLVAEIERIDHAQLKAEDTGASRKGGEDE